MFIENHSIGLGATHKHEQSHVQKEVLFTRASPDNTATTEPTSQRLSTQSRSIAEQSINATATNSRAVNSGDNIQADALATDNSEEPFNQLDVSTYNLKMLVEHFTGREIDLSLPNDVNTSDDADNTTPTRRGSLIYRFEETYSEFESSQFFASGQIELKDGKLLEFDFSATSQRQFFSHSSLEVTLGEVEVIDPLVINLNANQIQLTESRVTFDLDNDKQDERIYFATGTSGFLALDKNGNGAIDNGSEVFGALTGNGFIELSEFDHDNNRFIDEGDEVFNRLLFYQKDEAGNDQLRTLHQLGIGALYLGHVDAPFQIKSDTNSLQALARSSGLFLYENGNVGQLQQIDLVV